MRIVLALSFLALLTPTLALSAPKLTEQLTLIKLPPGFEISIYAENVENARQLALGEKGTVFAGSTRAGKVHAVVDSDSDNKADRVYLIDEDLKLPSGIEFRDGSLYVATLERVLRYDDIEIQLEQPPEPHIFHDGFPNKTHHGWKYLRFGPGDNLYVPVGAPCNICDEAGFGELRRISLKDNSEEVFAWGLRNTVGLAFHPDTGELWLTDNGRDMLGDNFPADELNHAPRVGMHFGYPWCHQGDSLDPEYGEGKSCNDYTAPAQKLGAHVAALGLTFYNGEQFPQNYHKQLFIAQHGSWNRTKKTGYNILLVRFNENGDAVGTEVFASGWLQGEEAWGRPNDILQMPDGALLVSDDKANTIYRISYKEPLTLKK